MSVTRTLARKYKWYKWKAIDPKKEAWVAVCVCVVDR